MTKEMPFILQRHIPFKNTLTSSGKVYQLNYKLKMAFRNVHLERKKGEA